MKKDIRNLLVSGAGLLITQAPNILENVGKNKEKEKNFFEENRIWIFAIILTIFVTNLGYINMFSINILDSIINILFGIIVLILTCLFLMDEKNLFKTNSNFFRFLIVVLITLGIINSFCHIGCGIFNLFTVLIK